MSNIETVRVNFEFPKEQYPYLKFLCSKRGLSLRKMVTDMLLKEIEESEDLDFAKLCDDRVKSRKDSDLVDWDDAQKLAGWE